MPGNSSNSSRRVTSKKGAHGDTAVYRGIFDEFGPTEWLAYETLETESKPLALLSGGSVACLQRDVDSYGRMVAVCSVCSANGFPRPKNKLLVEGG